MQKTYKLSGSALELARNVAWLHEEAEKRTKQLESDLVAIREATAKEHRALMDKIIAEVGLDKKVSGGLDLTYLPDHGDAFLIVTSPTFGEVLEGLINKFGTAETANKVN